MLSPSKKWKQIYDSTPPVFPPKVKRATYLAPLKGNYPLAALRKFFAPLNNWFGAKWECGRVCGFLRALAKTYCFVAQKMNFISGFKAEQYFRRRFIKEGTPALLCARRFGGGVCRGVSYVDWMWMCGVEGLELLHFEFNLIYVFHIQSYINLVYDLEFMLCTLI